MAGATPETRERRCPRCGSTDAVAIGHVVSEGGLIKAMHLCTSCQEKFAVVHKPAA
jgi:transposase-like protein